RARLRALGLLLRGGLKVDGFTQSYPRHPVKGNVLADFGHYSERDSVQAARWVFLIELAFRSNDDAREARAARAPPRGIRAGRRRGPPPGATRERKTLRPRATGAASRRGIVRRAGSLRRSPIHRLWTREPEVLRRWSHHRARQDRGPAGLRLLAGLYRVRR